MADRTSAGLFADIFCHLAGEKDQTPHERDVTFARWLWEQTRKYDFSPYQMGCDEALETLGLARLIDKTPLFAPHDRTDNLDRYRYWEYGPKKDDK